MKDILDDPEGKLTIHELQAQIKDEIIDFLKFDSDKRAIYNLLLKKYGSKNRKYILEEIINTPSEEDRSRCKNLRWTMLGLLLLSGLISIYLYYTYGAPKWKGSYEIILIQVLISTYLIHGVLGFTRQIFSIVQLLNIGKFILIFSNIVNGKYPEFVYAYVLILGSIHLVSLYIKRIGFDRYGKMLELKA